MSDFRPPAPTYRAQVARAWAWWKSTASKPQLWAVYAVFFGCYVVVPEASVLFPVEAARLIGITGAVVSMLIALHSLPRTRRERAQLTIPDLVFFAAALLIIAGLAEPIYDLLNQQASELGTGAAYLLQMVVPGLLVTLLIILFAIASGGGQ